MFDDEDGLDKFLDAANAAPAKPKPSPEDIRKTKAEYPLKEQDCLPPKPVFVLNEGQLNVKQVAIDYISGKLKGVDYLTIGGFAGTGKTFTSNRIVEEIRENNPGISFGMTAPTHKAVRQLKKHSELKDQLDFGTIHSFLGLKEVMKPHPRDKKRYIVRYEPDFDSKNEKRIDSIDVLFIDESSMLGDELFEHVDNYRRGRPSLKVIFMGDPLQIPPVNDKEDDINPVRLDRDAIPFVPAQQQSHRIRYVELSEIVRQGMDNPIIAYSAAIREQYKNQAIKHEFKHTNTTGVEQIPRNLDELRKLFSIYFDCDAFRADPDHMKIIAWRNETVNYFNTEVRLWLHRATTNTLPRIMNGEKLILNKPIIRGNKIVLANNEELEVISHTIVKVLVKYKFIDRDKNAFTTAGDDGFMGEIGEKHLSQEFKAYRSVVKSMDSDEKYTIDILHEDDIVEFEALRKKIETQAKKVTDMYDRKEMWRQFFILEKVFANVNYNYAISAHKSQGSTYDYCISMEWDIEQHWIISERNRIRYVAATRASDKLFVVR